MIELLNRYDITSKARREATDSAYLSDVMGLLTRERRYEISDGSSQYNPFATNSFIRRNTWRNGDIYETENGQGVFLGAINDVGFQSTDAGRQTIVNAREPFATMLELTCEEGTLISDTTLSDYYIVSDGDATETTLTLTDTGTPSDIQVGDIISFGNYNVPRYAVTSATGSPSTSITIDRPLERGVDGAIVRVIRPAIISGPKALKNAFTAAGLTNYLGGSFDTMDEDDIEQQFLLRVFVRIESRVKLADHIKKIMEMTDLYFTVNSFGIINIFRGLGYDGSNIRKSITTSEIIRPVEISYERQNLFAGYDCLFVSSTNTDVVSGDANTSTIAQWGSKERWQPIDDQGQSITAYQYLYANSRAAQYFGERKLNYNGEMRVRIKCACKRSPSGTTTLYGFNLGDQVQVTYDMGGGKSLTNEPARVVGYTYDRANQYYSDLVLELNSWVDETTEPIIELGEDDMRYLSAASSLTTTAGSSGSVYVTADKGIYYWRDYVSSAPTVDSDLYYATANGGETRWVKNGTNAIVTSPVSWTPTFTGFGTVSGVTAYSWRVGSCLHFEYTFQSGSATSTEARVSLGFNGTDGNVTTANSYPTLQVIGHGAISNSVHSFVVMAEASKTYITFGLSEVYNLLVKRNGSDIANSSSVLSFRGSVRIQGW